MEDATGKAGAGKRVLDDNGNWIRVTDLSKSIQSEIKENSKKADMERVQKAQANTVSYTANKDAIDAKRLKDENDKLKEENSEIKDMLNKQGALLAKIEEGMGAPKIEETHIGVDVAVGPDVGVEIEVTPAQPEAPKAPEVKAPETKAAPKKLSEKQRVIAKLEKAGVEFEPTETTAVLKAKLKAYADEF